MRLTTEQATELAKRIVNSLRPCPPLAEWVEYLEGKNSARALRVFQHLRDHGPADGTFKSIAMFAAAYDADLAQERAERARLNEPPAACEACNGTGWVEATPIEAHNPPTCNGTPGDEHGDGGCWCTAVKPCRCTRGRAAQTVADQIHDERRRDEHGRSSAVEAAIARIHAA